MIPKLKNTWKQNQTIILFSFLLLIVAYGFKLFTYSFSIDTEIYMLNKEEMLRSWIAINRFSLVGLKQLTTLIPFNIFLANWVTIILFEISNLLTYHNFSSVYPYLKEKKKALIFLGILSTSPIFLEQFNFTLQNVEVAFFLILFQIALYFFIKYIKDDKIKYLPGIIILLTICIGCYQSFATMFITEIMLILWFRLENKKEQNIKKYIISAFLIISFSVILYFIVGELVKNILQVESSGYLKSQIGWLNGSITQSIINVIKSTARTYFGWLFHIPQFTMMNSVALLFILLELGSSLKKKEFFKSLLLCGIIVSPMIMSIALGSTEPIRSCLNTPIVIATILMISWREKKWYTLMIYGLIIIQIFTMLVLEYYDYQRYNNDVKMAQEIYEKIKEYKDDHAIIFVGSKDSSNNKKMIKGEVMGYSFFDHYGLSDRAITFMNAIHLDVYGDLNALEEAEKLVQDRPAYPNDQSILVTDSKVIIKLS